MSQSSLESEPHSPTPVLRVAGAQGGVRGTRWQVHGRQDLPPVCLFVFRTGADRGALAGLLAVLAVALVDGAYISLAALGVTRWARKRSVRRALQWGGAGTVAVFGLDVLMSSWGIRLVPSIGIGPKPETLGPFATALVLTAANPLTVLFWAGVFGGKVATSHYGQREIWLFSVGCVLATAIFLGAVAVGGAFAGRFLPGLLIRVVNAIVGAALLYFAFRLATRNPSAEPDA